LVFSVLVGLISAALRQVRATGEDLFAVRATGDSMDGGADPIRDGDWLVFRHARAAGLGAIAGRIALVQREAGGRDHAFQVKRGVNEQGRWILRSDNRAQPSYTADEDTVPVAVLVEHIPPETLAPAIGSVLDPAALGKEFGITGTPRSSPTWAWVRGSIATGDGSVSLDVLRPGA
jgi:hypothetical protein